MRRQRWFKPWTYLIYNLAPKDRKYLELFLDWAALDKSDCSLKTSVNWLGFIVNVDT